MKIYNWKQADIFIKQGCKVLSCGLGNKYKIYIEFDENDKFKELMKRWMAKEF